MKKNVFIFVFVMLVLPFCGFSQIKVNSSGKVGINNMSPAYELDVNGRLKVNHSSRTLTFMSGELSCPGGYLGYYGSMWDRIYASNAFFQSNPTILSDVRAKTDIRELRESKSKLLNLRPVIYKIKPKFTGNEKEDAKIAENSKKDHLGLIAQEVNKIFPEIINEMEDGTMGVRYVSLIPVLIKAFQEQQAEINKLEERIKELEATKN